MTAYDLRRLFLDVDVLLSRDPRMTLAQLSTHLGVDRHTIERAVRLATGITFREHQKNSLLVDSLSRLTQEGKDSVKPVALKLGYRSPAAFSRFIRKSTGKTPSEIRRDGA